MKHHIWFIYCTAVAGLTTLDSLRPLTALKRLQQFVPENRNIKNNDSPILTVSGENDERSGFAVSKFQLTRSDSSMHIPRSLRQNGAQQAKTLLPEVDRPVLRCSRLSQIGKLNGSSKQNVLSRSINGFDWEPRITQLQKQNLHSKPQNETPYQDDRSRSRNRLSLADRTTSNIYDRHMYSAFITDTELPKRQTLKSLLARSLKLGSGTSTKSIEKSRLQRRSVLLPRTKPDRAKKGKDPSSSKPPKNPTTSDPSSSGSPKRTAPNPSKSLHKDAPSMRKLDSIVAKASVRVQGSGIAHTANPDEGARYFPSSLNLPIYRKNEHYDQALAGAKIYPHASGKLGSIRADAEGRHVHIHIEPEYQGTASYEVRPEGGGRPDVFIVRNGGPFGPVKKHFSSLNQSKNVHVTASLVGPGYVSATAHSRGPNVPVISLETLD